MESQFTKGGQIGWFHDQGHSGGFFHTYDRLQIAGPQDTPRKVHVFLPRDYETNSNRYPVIYMNDGDTAFFPGGAVNKSWHIAEILSDLYRSNLIRPVIVVAICPLQRDYEYTHAQVQDRPSGGLPQYAAYVATAIKGFIDSSYRTLANPQNRMILGSSHGGLAAFYIATHYPHHFRLVGALSPSFWVGLDSEFRIPFPGQSLPFLSSLRSSPLIESVRSTLQNPQERFKLYLDWGLIRSGGTHNSFIEDRATVRGREMRDLLVNQFGYRLNEDLFVVEDPQGDHTEESWSRRMPYVLKLFFGSGK